MNALQTKPLTNLMLIVTEACNLRCSHCYEVQRGYNEKRTMMWKTAKKAVDFFLKQIPPEVEHSSITFFGGEPTLEFDLIKKVIDYTRDHRTLGSFRGKRHNYVINTNGILLTEEMSELYRQLGSKICIRVSVDGYAENQNVVRKLKGGQGSWEKVRTNLQLYRTLKEKYGVKVNLVTTISRNTYKNIFYDYTRLYEMAGLPIGFLFVHEDDWRDEDFPEIKRQILKLHNWCIGKKMRFPLCNIKWRPHVSENICSAGVSSLTVNYAGDIYPCHRCYFYGTNDAYRLGNIKDGISEDKRTWVCDINRTNLLPDACQSCNPIIRGKCHICFASNQNKSGSFHEVTYGLCALMKELHHSLTDQERNAGSCQDKVEDEAGDIIRAVFSALIKQRDGSTGTVLK